MIATQDRSATYRLCATATAAATAEVAHASGAVVSCKLDSSILCLIRKQQPNQTPTQFGNCSGGGV